MLSTTIAIRFLTANKLRSFFIMLGIAVGVAVQIFIGILIDSLQQSLVNQTVGRSAHISVAPAEKGETITGWQGVRDAVTGVAGVTKVQASASQNVFVTKGAVNEPGLVRGLATFGDGDIYTIRDALIDGALPDAENEIVIGTSLRDALGIGIGETLAVATATGTRRDMTVTGVFDLKVQSLNTVWIIATLPTVQGFAGIGDAVQTIELQVDDVFAADVLTGDVARAVNSDTLTETNWKEQNASLLSALQSQSTSSFFIQFFVLISVIIAVTSILTVTVLQKARQIGILKAMGQTDGASSRIFIVQGFFLGLGGILIGIPLGLGLFYMFNTFARNPDGTAIVEAYIRWAFVGITGLVVLLSATFAGLVPARQSSKLNPIEIIRNG